MNNFSCIIPIFIGKKLKNWIVVHYFLDKTYALIHN